jgi:hypothetical protein
MKKIEEAILLSYTTRLMMSLIKLLVYNLFFAHVFSCLWVGIAENDTMHSTSWIVKR